MGVSHASAVLRGNLLVASPPFERDCGLYEIGVSLATRRPGASAPYHLRVVDGVIRDFRAVGVLVRTRVENDTHARVTVRRNLIERVH